MAPVFVDMHAFRPDGGYFGPELELVQNMLPLHAGYQSLRKKQAVASVAAGPMTGGLVHIYQQTVQVQEARPEATTANGGNYQPSTSGATLFSQVNETNPSDAELVYVTGAPASATVKLRLSDVTDPVSAASHILRWRYRIPVTPSSNWTVTAQLVEASTVRATDTATGAAATAYVERAYTLSAAEANSITDYTNLFIVFTATVPGAVQRIHPASDSTVGSWTTQAGGSSNLYQGIDESTGPDNADYIQTPALAPGGAAYTYVATVTSVSDPLTDTGLVFRFSYQGTNAGTTVKVRLKQGVTTVKEVTVTSAAAAWTTSATTLTTTEAALITDFAALTLEVEGSYPASVASTAIQEAAPVADADGGAWTPTGSATLFGAVDETVASEVDFITSPTGEFTGDVEYPCTLDLGDLIDPHEHSGHVLRVRAFATDGVGLRVELLDNGTVIKSQELILGAAATTAITLTSGEASLINDYAALQVRLTKLPFGSPASAEVSWVRFETPAPRRVQVSWVEVEVPSASRAEFSWTEFEVPGVAQAYRGDVPTIFAGSRPALYEVTSSGFTDVSKVGGYATAASPGAWYGCSMGNDPIFTNRADPVQYRAGNTGLFADLITTASPPKARFCAVARNQLFLGDINLTGHFPDTIWWSYFDNARDFSNAPQGQGGNARIVSRPGQLMGLVGGDFVTAFKRNSMHLIGWQGGAIPWRVDDISAAVGTPYPKSIIQTPYGVLFFDGSTFRRYNGGTGEGSLTDIGSGILSQFMTDTLFTEGWALDSSEPADIAAEDQRMIGAWDPYARCAIWVYQNAPYVEEDQAFLPLANRHTRAITYNPAEDRWGVIRDASLLVSLLLGRPNVLTGDQHLLRGTIGFDWDGTNTSWFRFDGSTTYEGQFRSKRRSLGIEEDVAPIRGADGQFTSGRAPQAFRLTGLMPVFSQMPRETQPPALTVTVETSNDPFFFDDQREKVAELESANAQGIMPCDITGSWWWFTATFPEMSSKAIRSFRGLYAFGELAGTPGGR